MFLVSLLFFSVGKPIDDRTTKYYGRLFEYIYGCRTYSLNFDLCHEVLYEDCLLDSKRKKK